MAFNIDDVKPVGEDDWGRPTFQWKNCFLCIVDFDKGTTIEDVKNGNVKLYAKSPIDDKQGEPDYPLKIT